jgi:hypothetical protein
MMRRRAGCAARGAEATLFVEPRRADVCRQGALMPLHLQHVSRGWCVVLLASKSRCLD